MPDPLWAPSPDRIAAAALTRFRVEAERRSGRALPDYAALHAWSVEDPDAFWRLVADEAELPFATPPARVRGPQPMPATTWFEGATLNYARALLHPPGLDDPARDAVIGVTEAGDERRLSWRDLRDLVGRIEASLRRDGVGRGDRVAAFAANLPETLALLLACASVGAVFSSCSPDFGVDAAGARFGQIAPTLLFASTAYRYGGRRFDVSATVARLAAEVEGLRRVVLLPYPGEAPPARGAPLDAVAWGAWLEAEGEPTLAPLPFDHPLYVLYSSGTTGLPKAMVHRAGGALVAHWREQRLHGDVRPGDVVFYFSTCGWMMWNWLASALAQAATVVLYEGSPGHPDLGTLWRMAGRLGVTFFGTSARYLHTLQGEGVRPAEIADLGALRTVASTGSPLSPAGFRYVYDHVKRDVHLASICGGTDIVSCFLGGVPTLPVYAGEVQGPGLGVDLAVFDDEGRPVRDEPGELVCRAPLPSMPLRFLNDPDGSRYRAAYFDAFPGVWRHGDRIAWTEHGGLVVYGRSDATLNPGGVRIGTAEIYRPLESIPEVVEAVAVGKRVESGGVADEEIWLFVVLGEGRELDADLVGRIRRRIREEESPRHVPRRVLQVPALPRTRSGKAMEIAVARLVNGRAVPNREVMANPEALDAVARAVAEADAS